MAKKANLDTAEKLDITIRRGDSFELLFNIKDNDGNNVPLETNDYVFSIQVQSNVVNRATRSSQPARKVVIAGSTLDVTKSSKTSSSPATNSIFFFDDRDDDGNIKLRANAADTALLPVGNYVYDIQYSFEDDNFKRVKTLLKGNFIIKEDITTVV